MNERLAILKAMKLTIGIVSAIVGLNLSAAAQQCSVVAGQDSVTCVSVVALSATPGTPGNYLYEWTPHSAVTNPYSWNTGGTVLDQTYVVTMTDTSTGCIVIDSVRIGAYVPINDTIELCGDSVQLKMYPNLVSYNWTTTNDTSMAIWVSQLGTYTGTSNHIFCGTLTHTFTVTSCLTGCSHVINYNSQGSGLCHGDSVEFSATGNTPISSWSWDFGDTTTSSLATPSHLFADAGTYTVTLIALDTNGCTDTVVEQIVINDIPMVDAGIDTTVCQGDVSLNATPSQPGNYSYQWSPPIGLTNPYTQATTASNVFDRTYTVTITNNNTGCAGMDSVTVSAIPIFADTVELCGDSVLLEMPVGGLSYTWQPTNSTDMSIWVSQLGTYTGVSTHAGCGSLTHTYEVTPCYTGCSHLINYSNIGSPCGGDTIQFNTYSNTPTTSWLWDFGDGTTSNQANPVHVYTQDGYYTVSVINSDPNNCIDTTTISDIFYGPFDVWIDVSPLFGCQQCVDLSSSSISATSYAWKDENGNIISTNSSINDVCHVHDEVYILNASNISGCLASDTVMVSSYNPVSDTFYLCEPNVILDFGPGASNYYWQTFIDTSGTSYTLTDTTQTLVVTEPGTYFGYADFPGCGSLTSLFTVDTCPSPCWNNFTYSSTPQGSCGDSVYFNSSSNTQAITWSWDFGDGTTSNLANPVHFFSAGVYTVSLTTIDAAACSYTSQQTLSFANGISVNAGPDTTVCQSALQLSATVSPPGNYTYNWSPSFGLNNTGIANPTANMVNNLQYTVVVTDTTTGCTATDNVRVSSYNNNNSFDSICSPQFASLNFGPGANSYHWQTFTDVNGNSTSLSATTQGIMGTQGGTYFGYADFPVCGVISSIFTVVEMCPDSVWPGDANSDGHANNVDLLSIGVAFGATGPARFNASNNWIAQAAQEWTDTLNTGVNYKHVDCDGNGAINMDDTLAIVLNYGLVHSKAPADSFSNGAQLYMLISQDTVLTGTLVNASIRLGTNNNPATNVYGLAFSLSIDPTLVDTSTITVSYANSWLGVKNQDMLGLSHYSVSAGRLDAATTRINHANASGYGQVADVGFITIDNLSGKDQIIKILNLMFSDVVLIDADGNLLPIVSEDASVVIVEEIIGIDEITSQADVLVYPNPATDLLLIQGNDVIQEVRLYDAYGKIVMVEQASKSNVSINVSSLSAGIYYAEIWQNEGVTKKRFTIIEK